MPHAARSAVSVCMAAYNGERHIEEQIGSILAQLGADDELIIVDDRSTDGTRDVVRRIEDDRIRLVARDVNLGYVRTFEEALGLATRPHVLLSDQDDVWLPGRVDAMSAALELTDVVATNLGTLDGPSTLRGPFGQSDWRLRAVDSRRHGRNILGILLGDRPYYGCAMGLRRSVLPLVLPLPSFLHESHDLWLALAGNVQGSITHLEVRSLDRRLHDSNQTPDRPRGPGAVVRSRLVLLRCLRILRTRRRVLRNRADEGIHP